MSTALSIAEPWPNVFAALNPFVREESAVSPEAQAVTRGGTAVNETIEHSEALFGKKSAAISQLNEIADECGEQNWDGSGARAIDLQALLEAEDFIRALPPDVALPEFAPEPDGSISLDWINSRNRLFSTSVGGGNRLAFAWLDGTDKGHGVAYFDGAKVPRRILEGINAIVNYENAPVRLA